MSKTILQVRLRESGLKGITVMHLQVGVRKNQKFREKHKVDYDAPANGELLAHFDGLQQNLIDLCSLAADAGTQDVRVTEARISPDGEFFQLLGTARTVGERNLPQKTLRISNDQTYDSWGECMAKVKALFAEAKSYITEKKVMDTNQMTMMLFESDAKFAKKYEEGPEAMTDEQRMQANMDWMTKKGAIVILPEFSDPGDGEEDAEDAEEVTETVPTEETAKETAQTGKVRKLTPTAESVVIPQDAVSSPFGQAVAGK